MASHSFEQLEASLLLCPQCRVAVPVRKRLLLILPEATSSTTSARSVRPCAVTRSNRTTRAGTPIHVRRVPGSGAGCRRNDNAPTLTPAPTMRIVDSAELLAGLIQLSCSPHESGGSCFKV